MTDAILAEITASRAAEHALVDWCSHRGLDLGRVRGVLVLRGRGAPRLPGAGLGLLMFWALALTLDEQRATETGELVCRVCSGRGEVIARARWSPDAQILDVPPLYRYMRMGVRMGVRMPVAMLPCLCDGPTRPDTVSLAWLVEQVAAMRSPILADWPDQWLVDLDQRQAQGRTDAEAVWWLAFAEWTIAGKAPSADVLADALRSVTPRRPLSDWVNVQVDLSIVPPGNVFVPPSSGEIQADFDKYVAAVLGVSHDDVLDATARAVELMTAPGRAREAVGALAEVGRMAADVAASINATVPDLAARVMAHRHWQGTRSALASALMHVPEIGEFWIEENPRAEPHPDIPPHYVGITFTGNAAHLEVERVARDSVAMSVGVVVWRQCDRPWWTPPGPGYVGAYG